MDLFSTFCIDRNKWPKEMLEVGSLRWRRNSRMLSHKLILGTFKNCCTMSKKEFSLSSFPWFFSSECLLISMASPFCFSSLSGKCQSGQLHLNLAIPWNEESDTTGRLNNNQGQAWDLYSTLPAAFPARHPQRPSKPCRLHPTTLPSHLINQSSLHLHGLCCTLPGPLLFTRGRQLLPRAFVASGFSHR